MYKTLLYKKFSWERFRDRSKYQAIKCCSYDEAIECCKELDCNGFLWNSGHRYTELNYCYHRKDFEPIYYTNTGIYFKEHDKDDEYAEVFNWSTDVLIVESDLENDEAKIDDFLSEFIIR